MRPRLLPAAWATTLVVIFSILPLHAGEEPAPRPNFVVFITDDESALERRAYGWSDLPTPNFERVAREGVLFTRAFCSAPSCAPARAALLTGRNFWELEQGAFIQAFLPAKFSLLPHLLEAAGYRTGYTGKGVSPYQRASRFGAAAGKGAESADRPTGPQYKIKHKQPEDAGDAFDYAANLRAFLDEDKKSQPFWFWVGVIDPHLAFGPDNPEKLAAKHGINLDQVPLPGFLPDAPGLRRQRAAMIYELLRADETLGKVLAVLEEKGQLDNTFLIVTADNGTWYPPHGKAGPYEWGSHVPLAIRWPAKVKPGRKVTDFVGFPDLAPTMLEAAQVPVPSSMSGRSLLPVLLSDQSGQVDPSRSFMVTGLEWHGELPPNHRAFRAIRDERHAYIRNYGRGFVYPHDAAAGTDFEKTAATARDLPELVMRHPDHPSLQPFAPRVLEERPAEELYDLVEDPWQLRNLAEDPALAKTKERLEKQMSDYQRETGDPRVTGEMKIFDATRAMVVETKKSGNKEE